MPSSLASAADPARLPLWRHRRQPLTTRLRTAAVVTAGVLWGITLPALFDPVLAVKFGADFVQYYTLGWLALHRAGGALYDPVALHAAQAQLVPALAHLHYPTVYPPQAGPLFALFALAPYRVASTLWTILSATAYVAVIARAAANAPRLQADRLLLWVGVLTFPPFWYLVLFRQNSIILLVALFVGVRLLERERSAMAGFAFGLLALKPQFGIPFAVFTVYRRDVAMAAGAMVSILVQSVVAAAVFGVGVLSDFARNVPTVIANANDIEPYLYKSLSLRTLSRLLPSPMGEAIWIAGCVIALVAMTRVCRPQVPVRLYMAVVILASALVNPHLYVYDGVVLALPFIWLGEWRLERNEGGTTFLRQTAVFLCATLLMMPLTLTFGSVPAVIATASAIVALAMLFWTSIRDLSVQYVEPVPQ